jgi:catechol-2,3-dioxygenase
MIKTFGLTHIALPVKDVKRSALFYKKVFGVKTMYRGEEFIQVQTPGSRDIIVFESGKRPVKTRPGFHFGFRLPRPSDMNRLVETVKKAGGRSGRRVNLFPVNPIYTSMIRMDTK